MNFEKSWIVAKKDFSVFRKKKTMIYSLLIFPVGLAFALPLITLRLMQKAGAAHYVAGITFLNAFSFYYMILPGILLPTFAAYTIVGEKIEKSLEPLLATPITDQEMLFGKALAAFIPIIVATYVGATIYMIFADELTHNLLGYFFYPNWSIAIILLLLVPLVCIACLELNVIVSSKVNDLRSVALLDTLIIVPAVVIYVSFEIGFLPFEESYLLIISACFFAADIVLYYLSRLAFNREEIFTS
jgi:ABC-type Na+ efflux pump permease subunit